MTWLRWGTYVVPAVCVDQQESQHAGEGNGHTHACGKHVLLYEATAHLTACRRRPRLAYFWTHLGLNLG
jgi:hypothetical protein